MTKVVINKCYGGFKLSNKALQLYCKRKFEWEHTIINEWGAVTNPDTLESFSGYNIIDRAEPLLIEVIEEIGCEEASGPTAELKIVDIEHGSFYRITEYDGLENIECSHKLGEEA